MAYRTIALYGEPTREEALALAALSPGHLIEPDPAGTGKMRKHATAGGSAERIFALEDVSQGKDVSDAYAQDARVFYGTFKPGDRVALWLKDGEVAVIGSKLESNGDGTLRVVDADASVGDIKVHSIVATALEAASPSGADVMIAGRLW